MEVKGCRVRWCASSTCAVALLLLAATLCGVSGTGAEEVKPFRIDVPEHALADLQGRLQQTRFPQSLEGFRAPDPWARGSSLAYMQDLVHYWTHSYNWTEQQNRLNAFPQFTTEIDGLTLHFIHVRSKSPHAVPLIFSHGWPGSVLECTKIIPLLTDEHASVSFHVVCPSLPGYGFSEAPKEAGFDTRKMAAMFAQLMHRLGYERYVAQGGDWGSLISSEIALRDPEHCIAIHINFLPTGAPHNKGLLPALKLGLTYLFPGLFLTQREQEDVKETLGVLLEETGYLHLQATRPHTVGYALNDSPVGLAAYIVEKFRVWSDCEGDVETRFTKDEILTNIMIYWLTQTMPSGMRLYYEQFHAEESIVERAASMYVSVPTGVALFPKEIARWPRSWVEYYYNVTRWTYMPSGGHFAALEEPEALVADIRAFVGSLSFASSRLPSPPPEQGKQEL